MIILNNFYMRLQARTSVYQSMECLYITCFDKCLCRAFKSITERKENKMKYFQTSIFSDYMAELLKYSLRIDAGICKGSDFIKLQQFEAKIINARNDGFLKFNEYKALYSIAMELHKEYRKALKLDK